MDMNFSNEILIFGVAKPCAHLSGYSLYGGMHILRLTGLHVHLLQIQINKGKVIQLHAMEALGGRGGIAPTHS
jgi:hypothetical protein